MVKRSYRRRGRKGGLKKMIKNMIQGSIETKTVSTSMDVGVSTVGVNYDISSIHQGTEQHERVGNMFTMSSFRFKSAFFHNQNSVDNSQLCRVVLYFPKNVTDTISTGTSAVALIDKDRYNVISDRLVPLSRNGQPCRLYNLVKLFNKGLRKGVHIRFSDVTANDFEQNRLMMYLVSTSAVNFPVVKGWWRFYFKDA